MTPDIILVSLSLFTWGVGEGMFFYFQPIYLQQLGASPLEIGSILGAAGLAMTVAHIPAGYLSDRLGRRPMVWIAWSCGILSAWLMALARTLPAFVTGLLFYSLTAFVSSPLFSYVTAARGRLPVGRATTLVSAMFNLGAVIGPLLGGSIGDRFGLKIVYLIAACIFILSLIILLFMHAQPRDYHDPQNPPLNLLSNPRYLSFLGVSFLAMSVMYLPQPLTPNFLQNERDLSLGMIGRLGSAGGLGNALLNLALGQLNARLGFLLGQVSVGLFALLLWRGEGVLWYAIGYFLLGGFRAARMLAFAHVRPLVHQAQMGLAYGITETVNSLAVAIAPPLAGFLYEQKPVLVYPVSLGLIVLSLLVFIIFAPRGPLTTQSPKATVH
jgi:DHA1 family tetracycline resistance protein-like MFS transporter